MGTGQDGSVESAVWFGADNSRHDAIHDRANSTDRRDTPERPVGIQLWGKPFATIWPDQGDLLTYYACLFHGNGRNIKNNDNNNFMYVGRLESTLFKDVFGKGSFLKLGADILNSRDDKGTNISQSLTLLVNSDGSLSPFTLPGADERTAWS